MRTERPETTAGKDAPESERPHEAASAPKDREELVSESQDAIAAAGYVIDEETPPYKSFGTTDRFLIRKCRDPEGEDVVVKVAAPERSSKEAVLKEARILSLLDDAADAASLRGVDLETELPRLDGVIQEGDTVGIATGFVEDDKEAKKDLTPDERMGIMTGAIRDLHALEVPDSVLGTDRPHWEQDVTIETAETHLDRLDHALEKAVKAKAIVKEDAKEIADAFESSEDLIASFPLKFVHGDLHGENLAYRRDPDGEEHVTLMDLEALRIGNEFQDWATVANRAALGRETARHAEDLASVMDQLKRSWLDASSAPLEGKIEAEISKHPRGKDAVKVFRLMRLKDLVERLSDAPSYGGRLAEVRREIYADILEDQLAELRAERRE